MKYENVDTLFLNYLEESGFNGSYNDVFKLIYDIIQALTISWNSYN